MFVNGLRFLTSISRSICFATGSNIPDSKSDTMAASLHDINVLYRRRGFEIEDLMVDGQFETLRSKASEMGMHMDTVARGVHVPEVERLHRSIEDKVRSAKATMPFKKLTKLMVVYLVAFSIFWLNAFPLKKRGISRTMSPGKIVTGCDIDYNNVAKLQPGEYVHTHENNNPTNTLKYRTVAAIALCPSFNLSGTFYYQNLETGRRLSRSYCTPIPMSAHVITR